MSTLPYIEPEEGVLCVEEGCRALASRQRLCGIVPTDMDEDGFAWLVELVCEEHADE